MFFERENIFPVHLCDDKSSLEHGVMRSKTGLRGASTSASVVAIEEAGKAPSPIEAPPMDEDTGLPEQEPCDQLHAATCPPAMRHCSPSHHHTRPHVGDTQRGVETAGVLVGGGVAVGGAAAELLC